MRVLLLTFIALICVSCASRGPATKPPDSFLTFSQASGNRVAIRQLSDFLARHRVSHVAPLHQLLQQGTQWDEHRQPRYAVPAPSLWPNMVLTLKLLDRFIIPAVGPIKVVSGFRTQAYNSVAGGARRSKHLEFSALDLIPATNLTRNTLHNRLQKVWKVHGNQLSMGLGLYQGIRFHIDTGGYRQWRG